MIVLGNFKIKMFIKVSFNYLVDLLSNYINFVVLFLNKMLNFESNYLYLFLWSCLIIKQITKLSNEHICFQFLWIF